MELIDKTLNIQKLEKDALYHIKVIDATNDDIVAIANAMNEYSNENYKNIRCFITNEQIKFIKLDKDSSYIVEAFGSSDKQVEEITNIIKSDEILKNFKFTVLNKKIKKSNE